MPALVPDAVVRQSDREFAVTVLAGFKHLQRSMTKGSKKAGETRQKVDLDDVHCMVWQHVHVTNVPKKMYSGFRVDGTGPPMPVVDMKLH